MSIVMSVEVDTDEVSAKLANLMHSIADVPDVIREDAEKAMSDAELIAKYICPVDTGRLSESIHIEGEFPSYALVADAQNDQGQYYGLMVEMGTSKMAARPFIWPAIDAVILDLYQNIRMHIKQFFAEKWSS